MSSIGTYANIVLSPDLDDQVRSELQSGERVVWIGQPRPGPQMFQVLPIVLFGIPWTAFAVFWTGMAAWVISRGSPEHHGLPLAAWAFPLFGVPFVLVGIGMLTSPFWVRRKALRTCYVLTDGRAIVMEPLWLRGVRFRSYGPEQLASMWRVERRNGTGDLIFQETTSTGAKRGQTRTEDGFLGVERVREVEELVRDTLLKPQQGG